VRISTHAWRRPATAAAAAGLLLTLTGVPATPAALAGGTDYTTNCPKPESLVSGTTWHRHRLSSAVTLREGRRRDANGYVDMHVLYVDTTSTRLHIRPLVRKLAMRSKLTSLASGRRKLVAATNAGYYDFRFGTPLGPVVSGGAAQLASSRHQRVVGFTRTNRTQAGYLWLAGSVRAGGSTRPLAGLNVLWPTNGVTVYTPRWGSTPLNMPRDALGRYVSGGLVSSGVRLYGDAPRHGLLLVARGAVAQTWLRSLRVGDPVSVSKSLGTDAPAPFRTAFGVGAQIVKPGGVARTDLTCRKAYPQPARTAVGFADRGRRLILAVVADHPGDDMHGLAAGQMARLMADLGAGQAYLLDGSGSTEMLARMPSTGKLSLRNWPADGGPDHERTMPVGIGIFR
jgi:hypothetical protein